MHDIKFIRERPEEFDAGLLRRGLDRCSARVLELDAEWRNATSLVQTAQARKNEHAKLVGEAKKRGDEPAFRRLRDEVSLKDDILKATEATQQKRREELDNLLAALPNLPSWDVPDGPDERSNKELRQVGRPRSFNFAPKQHFELGEASQLMDFEAAARISGARFVFLKGDLARLERAIASFMLDVHTRDFDYQEISPPLMVRDEAMFGTGQLPKFEEDSFVVRVPRKKIEFKLSAEEVENPDILAALEQLLRQVSKRSQLRQELDLKQLLSEDADAKELMQRYANVVGSHFPGKVTALFRQQEYFESLWLAPTAEVPLTNLVRDHIVSEGSLPRRYTAWTQCFRSEAGAAGKDTRGMIRMHQFSKVELVSITTPDQSDSEHERMTSCAEEILKRLGLPFRTMLLSTGDMGFSARKTYDIEVWLPGQNTYREISSCSNCGDFQARRMDARYRPAGDAKGTRFVNTLNGSGLAVGRTLVAVLENYQQADGSIVIPDVLKPYMGGVEVIAAHGA